MTKNYFLRDEEIHTVDDDFFRHQDVANNITRILETNRPPYNIAVIGKWGLGKSSLINLVTDKLGNKPKEYIKVYINAWKYEKEILGKVFLRQVLQKLDKNSEPETQQEKSRNIFEKIWEKVRPKESKSFYESVIDRICKYGLFLVIYAVVMFLIYAAYKRVCLWNDNMLPMECLKFWALVFTGYCRNIAVLLFAPILLTFSAQLISDIRKRALEKIEFKLPEVSVEDYEIELQRKIKETVGENKNFKIVIVLDDLDRLSFPKMVEALNAIKMFINYPNCIFIVPFDDTIIKSAIESVKKQESNKVVAPIESELLLDKLFQYKVYLAPLLKYDLKKYAVDLCTKNMQDFINDYCQEKIFVKVLRNVIVHGEVETPRQVKKIVNVFVTNMMIAKEREKVEKVEPGYATKEEGIFSIAKLSVLQADFNDFYDLLFAVPNAMEIVLKIQRKSANDSKALYIPEEIESYFGFSESKYDFKKEHMALLNFLNKTEKYKINNIMSYLYVAMEDISVLTGSVKQQEFMRAATSGNFIDAINFLEETPQLIEAVILYLQQEDDIDDLKNLMKCILQGFASVSDENRKRVASVIAERANEIAISWNENDENNLNFKQLLECYQYCDNIGEYSKILAVCLKVDHVKFTLDKIKAFSKYIHILSTKESALFNEYIKEILHEDIIDMKQFISIKEEQKLSVENYLQDYFKYLVRNIFDTEDYSKIVLKELRDSVDKLVVDVGINYCFTELRQLFGISDMTVVLKDFLQKHGSKRIESGILNELVLKQVSNADENESELNELLKCIDCVYGNETALALDKYFVSIKEDKNVGELIKNFASSNEISLIDNAIKEIVTWIFTTPNQEKVDCMDKIMGAIDAKRRKDILTKIKNACAVSSTKTYAYMAKLIAAYAKYHWEEISAYVSTLPSTISNEAVNDSYIEFVSDCFVSVQDRLTEQDMNSYVDALNAKIKQNKCVDSSVRAMCAVAESISSKKFLEIEPTIYSKLKEANCEAIYRAFDNHYLQFTKEKGNTKHLVDVCLQAIRNTDLQNRAIATLNKRFSYISQMPDLVQLIVKDTNIDKIQAYATVRKFLNNKEIGDTTNDVISMLKAHGNTTVKDILGQNQILTTEKMTQYILQNANVVNPDSLLVYIKWVVSLQNESFNESIKDLISLSISKSDTEEQYKDIVGIMDGMKKEQFKTCSKKYLVPMVNLINKTTSVELRRKIFAIAKTLRISKDVSNHVSEMLNGALDE